LCSERTDRYFLFATGKVRERLTKLPPIAALLMPGVVYSNKRTTLRAIPTMAGGVARSVVFEV
jgi:hypothetical protein